MGPRHVGAIGVAAVYVVSKLLGCADPLTARDKQEQATYAGEQAACIAANPGNEPAIDSCRSAVKKKWRDEWNSRFDGGAF